MPEAAEGRPSRSARPDRPASAAAYVASKAAIVGLTRALARELGEWNICVNTVTPDYIPHDEQYAFKRDQLPEDVVGTILYFAGHGSDFVTGQNLWVNGGRLFN